MPELTLLGKLLVLCGIATFLITLLTDNRLTVYTAIASGIGAVISLCFGALGWFASHLVEIPGGSMVFMDFERDAELSLIYKSAFVVFMFSLPLIGVVAGYLLRPYALRLSPRLRNHDRFNRS